MDVSPELMSDWQRLKKGGLKWLIIKSARDGDEAAPLITEALGEKTSDHATLWSTLNKVAFLLKPFSLRRKNPELYCTTSTSQSLQATVSYNPKAKFSSFPGSLTASLA
jgi:hypothetical protein